MAVVVGYGVRADGVREVLGLEVGLSEDVEYWRSFFQSLVARGLRGLQLVISDAHAGLKRAIAEVFVGAAWQRCRVHTLRTQWRQRREGCGWPLGRAAQRDDMPHLQPVVVDNDTLDEQRQDDLLVLESCSLESLSDPRAEGGELMEYRLRLGPLAPEPRLLLPLIFERLAA